jgi:hypothetical protein
VFDKRKLRKIFGPERNKLTGDWRALHNEEIIDLYCSTNIVRVIKLRRMRWAGHVACVEERKSTCRVLMGPPEGRRQLGRCRLRWEDNIKIISSSSGMGRARTGLIWFRTEANGERL